MSTKTNLPTDYDAAERFLLAAADGHYAACIRILHNLPPAPLALLHVLWAMAAVTVRLAEKVGGDAWHGVLRTTLAELRREADEASS